jgi:hypothetical protein
MRSGALSGGLDFIQPWPSLHGRPACERQPPEQDQPKRLENSSWSATPRTVSCPEPQLCVRAAWSPFANSMEAHRPDRSISTRRDASYSKLSRADRMTARSVFPGRGFVRRRPAGYGQGRLCHHRRDRCQAVQRSLLHSATARGDRRATCRCAGYEGRSGFFRHRKYYCHSKNPDLQTHASAMVEGRILSGGWAHISTTTQRLLLFSQADLSTAEHANEHSHLHA